MKVLELLFGWIVKPAYEITMLDEFVCAFEVVFVGLIILFIISWFKD